MVKYKMILWDFDGTLAYTGKDVWNSLEYAAALCGGKFPKDFMENDGNLGIPMMEIYKKIVPYPGEEKFSEFDALVTKHYRELSDYSDTYLYPGIQEVIDSARAHHLKQYIITMKPEAALERILVTKGWMGLFDGWYSPDSFEGKERTKSELISHVLAGGSAERECIYIGDTWSDIVASRENRIDSVGITYGDGDTKLLLDQNPTFVVDNAFEIGKILGVGE